MDADTTGGTDMNGIIKAMEYGFNPVKMFDTLYGKNKDNYRVHKAIANSNFPVYSQISGAIIAKMEDDEQLRWISDFAKNTGIDPSDWKYPIRMGYYGNAGAYGSVLASANRGIMNLYKKTTKKPIQVHNHYTRRNYYYR